MIELRRLAITDLSVTYARKMGENKIRHYRVPGSSLVLGKFTGDTPENLVVRHIRETEGVGDDVGITILPEKNGTPFFRASDKPTEGSALQVKDVTHIILKNYPEIEFSLAQKAVKSVIYQYNEDPAPLRTRFLSPITTFLNRGICKVNNLLRSFQLRNVDVVNMDRFEYLDLKIFQIPLLPMYGLMRTISVCSYLTVAFEEDDIQQATEALVSDLKLLNDKGLILGHLCMPSMLLLADSIGSGKSVCALFCFLFVDNNKLAKTLGLKSTLELPQFNPLSLIGVKCQTSEGGINYLNNISPANKYDIEIVDVVVGTPEAARQAHIENYKETLDQVNSIAKNAKEALDGVTVANKQSTVIGQSLSTSQVAVNADIIDKNGKGVSLDTLYERNRDRGNSEQE